MQTLMGILNNNKYKTDKHTGHMYVQDFYEKLFSPFQDKKINVLEIGVFRGESMKLWCDYFDNAKNVVGIDIFNRSGCSLEEVEDALSNYDVKLYNINSYVGDEDKLEEFKKKYSGGFDIIMDDGTHSPEGQLNTFRRFNSLMNEGGLYIIEDCGQSSMATDARIWALKSEVLKYPKVKEFKVLTSNNEVCIEIAF